MVLKYTETSNVLHTMWRFRRQFPNQITPCRQTIMDNYNKYVQYGLSLNRNVGKLVDVPVQKVPWNLLIVSRTLPISVYFKTIYTRSSTKNCGVGCAPGIVVQFFCFLFYLSVPVFGFTYRKALAQFQNIWLCNKCDNSFCLNDKPWKNRFSRFHQKVAQGISRLRF